jgi:phytoene/squalene synthetase
VFAYHPACESEDESLGDLARRTTRAASLQTYHTILLLVPRRRRDDAYLAYAYFRWVDDWLDGPARAAVDRLAFVERQRALIDSCFAGEPAGQACAEERMLIDLIRADTDPQGSLAAYIHNMMAVMEFDAERRGRLISLRELAAYQRALAVAVTEAMYYFLDGGDSAPRSPERFLAVTAAHITHMLRDTCDDLEAGYYNVPVEFLRQHNITVQDVDSPSYRQWVRMRVDLAREYFRLGRRYMSSSGSSRCRFVAHSYSARFEIVLDLIEADGYRLRADYGACKTLRAGLHMSASVLLSSLGLDAVGRGLKGARRGGTSGAK